MREKQQLILETSSPLFKNNQRYLVQRVGITNVEHVGLKAGRVLRLRLRSEWCRLCEWRRINRLCAGRNTEQSPIRAACALLSRSLWVDHRWRFVHQFNYIKAPQQIGRLFPLGLLLGCRRCSLPALKDTWLFPLASCWVQTTCLHLLHLTVSSSFRHIQCAILFLLK